MYLIFTDLTIPQDCFRWPRFLENTTISAQFHLPLATQACQEFSSLIHDLHSLTLSQSEKNSWSYIWGNGHYCSSKFYNFLFQGLSASTPFKGIWKSRCVMKLKVFAWLLLMDWLNTKNMLQRGHVYTGSDIFCVLCQQHMEETIMHLFFTCPFSQACWAVLNIHWNLLQDMCLMVQEAKQLFMQPFFMEIFIIATCLLGISGSREMGKYFKISSHLCWGGNLCSRKKLLSMCLE